MHNFDLFTYDEKNNLPKTSLFLGIIFILLGIIALIKSFSPYSVAIFGLGILFVLIYGYDLFEPGITILYAITVLLSILGLSQMIFNIPFWTLFEGDNLFTITAAFYLYPALILLRACVVWHKLLLDDHYDGEKHEKGYFVSLDALIMVASIIIFYTGISQLFGIDLIGQWIIGYGVNVSFLFSILKQKETDYRKTFGNKMNYWALLSSGWFMILIAIVSFWKQITSIFVPNTFFVNLGFILAGVLILIFTHYVNKNNE